MLYSKIEISLRETLCILVVVFVGVIGMSGLSSGQTSQSPSDPDASGSGSLTGPISGYMDFHYNNLENEDGIGGRSRRHRSAS